MSRSYKKLSNHKGLHHTWIDDKPTIPNKYGKLSGAGLKYVEYRIPGGMRRALRARSSSAMDSEGYIGARARARTVPWSVFYDAWVCGRIKTSWR